MTLPDDDALSRQIDDHLLLPATVSPPLPTDLMQKLPLDGHRQSSIEFMTGRNMYILIVIANYLLLKITAAIDDHYSIRT